MSFFERPAKSILHPTDFSSTSETAFAHALAIALKNKAALTILHVVNDRDKEIPWHDYPGIRKTLERWGYLDADSSRRDIERKLGVEIKKAVGVDKNVTAAIVNMVETHDFDLIVMATNENRENPFYSHSSTAVPVSQKAKLPTLFVPQDVKGCVSVDDGTTSLGQVLIPVNHQPDAQPLLERMSWALDNLGDSRSHVHLLYVGDENQFPNLVCPEIENVTWSKISRKGNSASNIISAAKDVQADVIAMMTEGKKGFWDTVLGSTVQKVLRKAPCPIFTIPTDDWI